MQEAVPRVPLPPQRRPGLARLVQRPGEFIDTHLTLDQRNPCHLTVDYDDPTWKDKLADAPSCTGQAQMYANQCKVPRTWKLPEGTTPNPDVFTSRQEFIAHHSGQTVEQVQPFAADLGVLDDVLEEVTSPCYFCKTEVDHDDHLCHGCEEVICGECDLNHTLMGRHQAEQHLDDPLVDEDEGL